MKCVLKLILIFGFSCAYSANFENEFNHHSGSNIRSVKIVGERCSGTNYTEALLLTNFPSLANCNKLQFGHKHFLCWFGLPLNKKFLNSMNYGMDAFSLEGQEDILFVFIVRNPYDWLRSFFLKPYHVDKNISRQAEGSGHLQGEGFSHFIRAVWSCPTIPIENLNPWTGRPFSNVLELRKYKILNYLHLGTLVDNFLLVRYEDVRDDPKACIDFIASIYNLEKKERFVPVLTLKVGYKKDDELYKPKKYFPISAPDRKFINRHIDWEVENQVGYFPL